MNWKRTFFLAGLLITASVAVMGTVSAQVPNSVYVDPAATTGDIGASVSISIMAFEVSGVNSYEIRLDYNTDILNATSAAVGTFITESVFPFATINDTMGRVTIGILSLDPLQEVSGSGVLGTIDFTVTGTGSSVLDIGHYNSGPAEPTNWLLNSTVHQIPHESVNGQFSNEPTPATGFLDISTTPAAGEIFVDGVSVGTGSAYVERPLGTYSVSFGDVAGWMTPDPQTVTLTTEGEVIPVVGEYMPKPTEEHDVAVISVSAPGTATIGDLVSISVVVENVGDFNETDVAVSVTADGVSVGIQTVDLLMGESKSLDFTWNTTGVLEGTYTIRAEVPPDHNTANDQATTSLYIFSEGPPTWTLNVNPRTLNLKSRGKWITVYIEPPESYDASDIDVSTIKLNNTISVDPDAPTTIDDIDYDGIQNLMVKIDRQTLIEYVRTKAITDTEVALTISGEVNETSFEVTDMIRVIH